MVDDCKQCDNRGCLNQLKAKRKNVVDEIDINRLKKEDSLIKNKIVVMSGKGGVGKSTIALNLAMSLMSLGKKVGLLDVDIHGPSLPVLLGLEKVNFQIENSNRLIPINFNELKVMSVGFLLTNCNDAVIWKGPLKTSIIKQFFENIKWGFLDYLIIDTPPGTGDEHLAICQRKDIKGSIIVTTPQRLTRADVRKSITFCRRLEISVLGIVENLSGFLCPNCGEMTLLSSGGGKNFAKEMDVPFWGEIPIDSLVMKSGNTGKPFFCKNSSSVVGKTFKNIAKFVLDLR